MYSAKDYSMYTKVGHDVTAKGFSYCTHHQMAPNLTNALPFHLISI